MKVNGKTLGNAIIVLLVMSMIFTPFANAASIYTPDSSNIVINELKYDPYPLVAGKYVTLWIKMDNNGANEADNVTCTLIPKYPFSLDSTENPVRTIGILPGMESAIIDYKIYVDPQAVDGNNNMDMQCQAMNGGALITRTLQLYVTSNNPEFAVGVITSQPTKLLPDTKDDQITVKLQNIGTGNADLVTTKLILPDGITPSESYSNVANIGMVAAGAVGTATFNIDIPDSLAPGVYPAQLEVQYRDSGGAKTKYRNQTLNVDINVRPAPVFVIENISTTPGQISQGDSVMLNILLKNAGSEGADSVSFKLYKQNDQPFTLDEKYDFIGNIKPNETGQAGFKITVDNSAALKTHLLEGEIRYIAGNDVFVVDKQIPVQVAANKSSGISPLYIAAGVIVLALIGIYYVGRKKKK